MKLKNLYPLAMSYNLVPGTTNKYYASITLCDTMLTPKQLDGLKKMFLQITDNCKKSKAKSLNIWNNTDGSGRFELEYGKDDSIR